jgi:hypothetical protein
MFARRDVLCFAWVLLGIGWMIYDCIFKPSNWSNFTSWVWLLQTCFFIGSLIRLKNELLHVYFLPIVFVCEFTTALAVVYMMVDRALIFDTAVEKIGPTLVWLGNFVLHYLTLIVLFLYMHEDMNERKRRISDVFSHLGFRYIVVLGFFLFTLIYAYCVFFFPVEHYGLHAADDGLVAFLLLVSAGAGLAVFLSWAG